MAADDDLICNFKKCRKRLKNFAWTTSCSHVFCDEDGTKLFNNKAVCPACETDLPGKYDIVRVDLQPSEEYKSMLLAGQRPETVVEICSRALSFWTYQTHQERIYQEYMSGKLKDKLTQVEGYYEQLLSRTQAELSSQKDELESVKKKYSESSEKLLEKTRQYQKLQSMYDGLRRRSVSVSSFDDSNDNFIPSPQKHLAHIRQQHWQVMGRMQQDNNKFEMSNIPDNGSKLQAKSSESGTISNLQVDPGLTAAVNVGALHQNVAIHSRNN